MWKTIENKHTLYISQVLFLFSKMLTIFKSRQNINFKISILIFLTHEVHIFIKIKDKVFLLITFRFVFFDMSNFILIFILQSTGELKKNNLQKVNQYLKSTEYIDDMISTNHIPVSQQNGTREIQLQYSVTNEQC